jgi:tetratricopeptide (TPR) repeat protein
VVSVLLLLVLGTVLCSEGWRACRVHWLRHGNSRLNPTPAPVSEEQRLDDLIAAARLAPESASLQVELALLYYDRYRGERIAALQTLLAALHQTASAIGLVPAAGCPGGSSWAFPLVGTAVSQTLRHPVHPEESMVRQHLAPALQHVLRARALCPVLPEPHLLLAHNQDRLRQADTRLAYLERVRLLLPRDAGLWYGCGEEYLPHNPERTWAYWRRALELSDDFLPVVLERARAVLRPQEMLDKVIPDRPRLLLDAAQQLDPQADAAERRPFLQRALAVLDRQPGPPDAESLYLRARLQVALGNSDAARQAYEAALRRSPHADERRYEYAQYLRSLDKLPEARRELQSILRAKPEHAAARQFLEDVSKELAERN